MSKFKIAILLGFICMLLTIGICIQIKTVNDSSTGVGKTHTENELRDSVLKWKEKYERLYEEETDKETELENLRQTISTQDTNSADLSKQLENYNMLLGLNEVTGQGLVITVKDANNSTLAGKVDLASYLVHDGDLLEIVNALREAGAEAISINDERMVSVSDVASINYGMILVNGRRTSTPYIVKAIGDRKHLESAITIKGGFLDEMRKVEEKTVGYSVEENIVITKYQGEMPLEYMKKEEKK